MDLFSTDMFNNHDQEDDLSVTFSNAYSYQHRMTVS